MIKGENHNFHVRSSPPAVRCIFIHLSNNTIMILCFVLDSNTIHHFNQNKYDSFLRSIPFHQLPCSIARIVAAFIVTRITPGAFISLRSILSSLSRVLRVRCTRCGTTHALLPHFVIPYQHIR